MSSATFVQTRSQALGLEKQTDSLLSKYSSLQYQVNASIPQEQDSIGEEIKDLLDKREDAVGRLNRISISESGLSTSKLQQLQRHKEVLQEHRRWYQKIKSTIDEERNRQLLLYSVRSDINEHKQRKTGENHFNRQSNANIDADSYILEEAQRADNTNSIADRLLQQAYATRDELATQQMNLKNMLQKVFGSLQRMPAINLLISKINTRRKRDTLILATVIASCIFFLIFIT